MQAPFACTRGVHTDVGHACQGLEEESNSTRPPVGTLARAASWNLLARLSTIFPSRHLGMSDSIWLLGSNLAPGTPPQHRSRDRGGTQQLL